MKWDKGIIIVEQKPEFKSCSPLNQSLSPPTSTFWKMHQKEALPGGPGKMRGLGSGMVWAMINKTEILMDM